MWWRWCLGEGWLPVPEIVRSVPPASEPCCGETAVIRGGSSASKGAPAARSIMRVASRPRYASPRLCQSLMACKLRLKVPPRRPASMASSTQPKREALEWTVAICRGRGGWGGWGRGQCPPATDRCRVWRVAHAARSTECRKRSARWWVGMWVGHEGQAQGVGHACDACVSPETPSPPASGRE